jgi:hypothetical protein
MNVAAYKGMVLVLNHSAMEGFVLTIHFLVDKL